MTDQPSEGRDNFEPANEISEEGYMPVEEYRAEPEVRRSLASHHRSHHHHSSSDSGPDAGYSRRSGSYSRTGMDEAPVTTAARTQAMDEAPVTIADWTRATVVARAAIATVTAPVMRPDTAAAASAAVRETTATVSVPDMKRVIEAATAVIAATVIITAAGAAAITAVEAAARAPAASPAVLRRITDRAIIAIITIPRARRRIRTM